MKEKEEIYKIERDQNLERIESGPIQFGQDWPGVFIRGDDACYMSFNIFEILEMIKNGETPDPITLIYLKDLGKLLGSCRV